MLPPPKRQLRPTASLPTTAETYGEKHGLPEDLTRQLENVGRAKRAVVSQGRGFQRSTTTSVLPLYPSHPQQETVPPIMPTGWQTSAQTLENAKAALREEHRQRELQPFYAASSSSHSPSGSPPPALPAFSNLAGSKKRKDDDEDGDDAAGAGDTDTEMDEDDDAVPSLTQSGSTAATDDFPPVFQSPHITHPELFAKPALPSRIADSGLGRQKKGLPARLGGGRTLGKTVSAPVFGAAAAWGMEVDAAQGEDGFDVAEWAKGEDF